MLLIILGSIIKYKKQFIVVISSYLKIAICQHALLGGAKFNFFKKNQRVNKQSLMLELQFPNAVCYLDISS